MAKKTESKSPWHRNPAVLAAVIGGVCAVLAAAIGGLLSLLASKDESRSGENPVSSEVSVTVLLDQLYGLPQPGERVEISGSWEPPTLVGVRLDADDPYHVDFILDRGDVELESAELTDATGRLVRYFLTALCLPEDELWVNLSPYEADQIIPERFGQTRMGRDFLAQDYLLKQLSASLSHPDNDVGSEYWRTLYALARKELGTTDLRVDTFNKVWIVPKEASVYLKNGTAVVTGAMLEVLTEEDYLAAKESSVAAPLGASERVRELAAQTSRKILIPHLSREVNTGRNFGLVRQAFSALILATWYKRTLRDSLLTQRLADQSDVPAVLADGGSDFATQVYERYMVGYQKGVFNFIREDRDPDTQEIIPRKYYSGGITARGLGETVTNRSNRRRLTVGVLQSAVLMVHVSLFGSVSAAAPPDPAPRSGERVEVVDAREVDPGGIDFGVHFDLKADGDDSFTFTPEGLAKTVEKGELSPQVLGLISFSSLSSLMTSAH